MVKITMVGEKIGISDNKYPEKCGTFDLKFCFDRVLLFPVETATSDYYKWLGKVVDLDNFSVASSIVDMKELKNLDRKHVIEFQVMDVVRRLYENIFLYYDFDVQIDHSILTSNKNFENLVNRLIVDSWENNSWEEE